MCKACEDMSAEDREDAAQAMKELMELLGITKMPPTPEESLENMSLMLGGIIWQLGKEFTVTSESIKEFAASGMVIDGNENAEGNFTFQIVPEDEPLAQWEKELLADGE